MPDPSKLKMAKDLGRPEICLSVARVPQTARLFVGGADAKVYHIDLGAEKIEPVAMEGHTSYVTGVALAGAFVVSGSYDGKLIWWNAETREKVRTVDAHGRWIRKVAATPDGRVVASVADDMLCKLWNAETGELLHTLADHKPVTPNDYPSMLFVCTISADGTLVATADKVGHVVIWEIASGKKLGSVEASGLYTWDPTQRRHSIGGVRSLAFSPDQRLIAAGGIGKIGNIDHLDGPSRLEIFDWQAGKKVHEIEDSKLKGLIERLAYDPSGNWIVAAGGDNGGFVNFYDAQDGKLLKQEKAPMHVHDFALNDAYDTLYTVGHHKIAVWEFKGDEPPPAEAKPAEEKKES
jgi:WD40 repeat protein